MFGSARRTPIENSEAAILALLRISRFPVVETEPAALLSANQVVVLQPNGSLFFAAAPIFEACCRARRLHRKTLAQPSGWEPPWNARIETRLLGSRRERRET